MEIESIKSVGAANSGAASSYVPPVSDTSGNSVKVNGFVVHSIRAKCKIRQMKTER